MNEKISVIIPAYNRENTIVKCVESVLAQSYENLEVLVVDDGSTDKTKNKVLSIKDPRVQYLSYGKNRGACYARNYGVDHSTGLFIAFQDSDDVWYPEKLQVQYEYLKRGNYDFVFCSMSRINNKGQRISYPINKKAARNPSIHTVLLENCASTQTMFMKKHIAKEVRFDEKIKKYQDWDFMLRVVEKYKVGFIEKDLLSSEVTENSISKVVDPLPAIEVIYNKYSDLINSDREVLAAFEAKFGDANRERNLLKAGRHYVKSIKMKFTIKVLIKMVYCAVFSVIKRKEYDK